MGVAIKVRNVPAEVRHELEARAARAGQTFQEYLRRFLIDAAERPTATDVIARARARVSAAGAQVATASILAARDVERR